MHKGVIPVCIGTGCAGEAGSAGCRFIKNIKTFTYLNFAGICVFIKKILDEQTRCCIK
jgi:hypothetical protein